MLKKNIFFFVLLSFICGCSTMLCRRDPKSSSAFSNSCSSFKSCQGNDPIIVFADAICTEETIRIRFKVPEARGRSCIKRENGCNYEHCNHNRDENCEGLNTQTCRMCEDCELETYHYKTFAKRKENFTVWVYGKGIEQKCDATCVRDCEQRCPLTVDSQALFAHYCDSTTARLTSTPAVTSPDDMPSTSFSTIVIVVVFLSIVLLIFLIAWFGHLRKRKVFEKQRKYKFYETVITPRISLTLLLAAANDEPKQQDILLKFAGFLSECYSINVILDLYSREQIYADSSAWLEKSMLFCDVILIIWSEGAEKRWHSPDNFTDQLEVFTPVLKQLNEDLIKKKDLSKYVIAHLGSLNGNDIPKKITKSPIPCFNLIRDFHVLCRHLVEFSNKSKNPAKKSKVKFKKLDRGKILSGSVIALENCFLEIGRNKHCSV